jgi:methyl-accepting chemotaxis protein
MAPSTKLSSSSSEAKMALSDTSCGSSPEDLRGALAANLPILPVLSAQLRQTAAQVEQAVVEVCNNFEAIAARTQANVTRTTCFLGNQGSRSGERVDIEALIEASRQTLETLLNRLGRASDKSASAIEKLRAVELARERIVNAIAGLTRITMGNRILAVNARIQAAGLGHAGAGIAALSNEISAHAREANEIAELVVTTSDLLSVALGSAMLDLEETASADRVSIQISHEDVERTMTQFRATLDSTREFMGAMASEGETLSSDIFGAVRGLQFQDRTSQRISHVTEEIDRMHDNLSACLSASPGGKADGALADLARRYTMAEERTAAGDCQEMAAAAGDVELF